MRRLYLYATNEFTLNPIQTGGGFGSHPPPYQAPPPTPLPPSLPNRSSYDHETWRLFLKMFSGHFNVIVTCTSTFRLTLQPTFYSHVLQNLPFKNWIKFIFYQLKFSHTLTSAIFHVIYYNCQSNPSFLVIDLRKKNMSDQMAGAGLRF